MSDPELLRRLSSLLDRREFLRRTSAAVFGVVMGLLGLPGQAAATYQYCCTLCFDPGGSCSGCACQWCWTCRDTPTGRYYRCCECYTQTYQACNGTCSHVKCSTVALIPGTGPTG